MDTEDGIVGSVVLPFFITSMIGFCDKKKQNVNGLSYFS